MLFQSQTLTRVNTKLIELVQEKSELQNELEQVTTQLERVRTHLRQAEAGASPDDSSAALQRAERLERESQDEIASLTAALEEARRQCTDLQRQPLSVRPSVSPPAKRDDSKLRDVLLADAFKAFDLDNSGSVESAELMQLGTARRSLNQRGGSWDETKNARLLAQLDSNGDGQILVLIRSLC